MNRRQFLLSTATVAAARVFGAGTPQYRIGYTTNTMGGWEGDPFIGFREAHELGYHWVEQFIAKFPQFYPDKPKELQKRLDDIGVGFVTISNGGPPTETHFEDPAKRDQIIADHLRLVRFIKNFGCDHLKINLGHRSPDGTSDEDLKHIADTLEALGKRITDEEGIRFGVHAHMWSQFENRHEIDYVMGNTDPKHVWFVLDTGHVTMAGIDPLELARKLGHRVVEFHIKDTKPEYRGGAKTRLPKLDPKDPCFTPLGTGGVDFVALKNHLDKTKWQGFLTVELDASPWRPPKESARITKEYIESTLKIPL